MRIIEFRNRLLHNYLEYIIIIIFDVVVVVEEETILNGFLIKRINSLSKVASWFSFCLVMNSFIDTKSLISSSQIQFLVSLVCFVRP